MSTLRTPNVKMYGRYMFSSVFMLPLCLKAMKSQENQDQENIMGFWISFWKSAFLWQSSRVQIGEYIELKSVVSLCVCTKP